MYRMPGNNYRQHGGAVPNNYKPSRKLTDEVDSLLERTTTLETSNALLMSTVAQVETEKATLELRLAALERWVAELTRQSDSTSSRTMDL